MLKRSIITTLVVGGLTLATTNLKAQSAGAPYDAYSTPQSSSSQNTKDMEQGHMAGSSQNCRSSSLIGLPVRNDSGDKLGKVDDLIVNIGSQTAPFAIIEYGGAVGIGAKKVAVPLSDLKWSSSPKELILSATKEQFETASSTPTGAWASFAGEAWAKDVDRYYGQPSHLSRFERQESSGVNEGREPVRNPADLPDSTIRQNQAPVPMPGSANISSKLSDPDLTSRVNDLIRQNAPGRATDIKATVKNGTVTLRGKVATDAQKQALENQIKALPGVQQVQDVLVTAPE